MIQYQHLLQVLRVCNPWQHVTRALCVAPACYCSSQDSSKPGAMPHLPIQLHYCAGRFVLALLPHRRGEVVAVRRAVLAAADNIPHSCASWHMQTALPWCARPQLLSGTFQM